VLSSKYVPGIESVQKEPEKELMSMKYVAR
jgi:hypothetical protein